MSCHMLVDARHRPQLGVQRCGSGVAGLVWLQALATHGKVQQQQAHALITCQPFAA